MSIHSDNDTRIVKRKRRLRKRVYFIVVPILVILLAGTALFVRFYMKADAILSDSYQDDGRDKSDLRLNEVDPKVDDVSILLMGVDSSDKRDNNDNARTDALMVATLNKDDKSVKLVSIPRDSLVHIPEIGYETRINHAHANGGVPSTIETVEGLLDIPIDYWVKVNFHSFIDVVDALDGITVDVPYEFQEQDSHDRANAIHLQPGVQELEGEEALALARTRKLDNDIERGKRQQQILKAIIDRTISLKTILKFDDLMEAVGKNMETSMSPKEVRSFVSYGTSGKKLDIEMVTLDGIDYQPGNMYYWKLDELALEDTRKMLQDHLGYEPPEPSDDPIQEQQDPIQEQQPDPIQEQQQENGQ